MKTSSWLIFVAWLALAGCAPAVSTTMQPETGPRVGFAELSAQPEKYQGQTKILGGEVMRVRPQGRGSLLIVDQHDLDSHLFPSTGASGGTFLVESDEWLSPGAYQPKSVITVAGVVEGKKDGLLLLKARQIHLWEGPRWEKWYYPVPREWYGNDPNLERWYTPPYFSPWYPGTGR
ncbi:MAG: Slp family lipoprotein [Deltaproteobacteria bacterium]|nr:Slp family lipoprotein [Deltaproteobacteria bacterium]